MNFKPQFEQGSFLSEDQHHAAWAKKAKSWGRMIGESYPKVWDSNEVVLAQLKRLCQEQVDTQTLELKPSTNMLVEGLLVAGCWIAGIWVPFNTGDFTWFLLLGGLGWIIFFVGVGSATKKANFYKNLNETLFREAYTAAVEAFNVRRQQAKEYEPGANSGDNEDEGFKPKGPMPVAAPYGVSHEGAETLVAHWMQFLGAEDATVTSFTSDGGVDVQSLHYIAQVKNYKGSVSVAEVRQLQGVASADGRKPLFFTSGTYTAEGLKFADAVGMAMFIYNAEEGTLSAACKRAEKLLVTGL